MNYVEKHPQLNDEFTFDTFVRYDDNENAYSLCFDITKNNGNTKVFNPLLIYGETGLGKTHLLHAIGNYIWQHNSIQSKICYTTVENFINELITAIKSKTVEEFTEKYSNFDVFLLDNTQELVCKEVSQKTLLNIFENLRTHKSQIVLASNRPLHDFEGGIEERLKSFIANGTTAGLLPIVNVLKKYTGTFQKIVIPHGIAEIGCKAFKDCTSLKSVTIHGNVSEIGSSAFENCTSLKTVFIYDGMKKMDTCAFKGCTSLTTISLPTTIMQIGKQAFHNCISLKEIRFEGTEEQWKSVKKDSGWNRKVSHCHLQFSCEI